MSTKTFALTCVVALLLSKHAFSAQLDVWCADDMVKIDPTSGKIHEADETKASDRPNGDYRIKNSIWDGKTIHLGRISASNKGIATPLIGEQQIDHQHSPLLHRRNGGLNGYSFSTGCQEMFDVRPCENRS